MKRCPDCGKVQPPEAFASGTVYCRPCNAARRLMYRTRQRDVGRVCEQDGCGTILSRYNTGRRLRCWQHQHSTHAATDWAQGRGVFA